MTEYADWATPHLQAGILPSQVDVLFWAFKQACVASAGGLSVPDEWVADVGTYMSQSETPPDDAQKVAAGSARHPTYYSGGLVLSLNSAAAAITLDDCVFVGSNWNPNTYIHEMVHVGQYAALGVEGFLVAYFGSAAVDLLQKWARGEPSDAMTASYLETEAYDLAARYSAWSAIG